MNTLVIGGTGLISGAIVRELRRKGHRVTVFHRGRHPLGLQGVAEIIGDRQDRRLFEAAMRALSFDAVVDMISFSREDAASAFRAFHERVRHFIHCSTVCAVGVPTRQVICDETEPYHPVSGYGRGKADGERFLLAMWRQKRFPVTIFRPSHTYGPGGGWVLGTFLTDWDTDCELVNRIRAGRPVVVHGDGTTLWQSCYCDDAAKGFVGALGKAHVRGQVYQVCGRDIMDWNAYVEAVGRAVGRRPKIVHVPTDVIVRGAPESATGFLREIAFTHGAYSIDKIRRDIPEFDPVIDVEEGTRRHIRWLRAEGRLAKAPKRPFEDRLARFGLRMQRAAARLR
ncbi:MAG: NAD-dependent epimerase/dehydratase family protein [Candidatus Coatesbacteria bacterium]